MLVWQSLQQVCERLLTSLKKGNSRMLLSKPVVLRRVCVVNVVFVWRCLGNGEACNQSLLTKCQFQLLHVSGIRVSVRRTNSTSASRRRLIDKFKLIFGFWCEGMWQWRASSRVALLRRLHNGPDTLEELVERNLVKEAKGKRLPSAGLTTTRREALALYREILRTTRLFTWTNEQGVPWRDLLRDSARMEYEQARYETDPEVIARLLVVGRDAVQAAIDKFAVKAEELIKKESSPNLSARPDRWD